MDKLSDETYHIFNVMTLRELLDYRLVSDDNRRQVDSSYVWCYRLQRDFGITAHSDCFEKYKQAYRERRQADADIVKQYLHIETPFVTTHTTGKDGLSTTAYRLRLPILKATGDRTVSTSTGEQYLRELPLNQLLTYLGITSDVLHGFDATTKDYLCVGLLIKSDDVIPMSLLNLLTSAWGGDIEQTREYKEDYVMKRQTLYLRELRDYAVKMNDKRVVIAFKKINL